MAPFYSLHSLLIFWSLNQSFMIGKVHSDPTKRSLQDFGSSASSFSSSFDLLCRRLDQIPDFLCECVSQIPFRSIECQSTEICSLWRPDTCGQFIFQVNYMGPDISQLQSCVSYTQRQLQLPDDDYNYRDGCFTLDYGGDNTPTSCRLSFLGTNQNDGGGELENCESCSLCADGTAIQASCDQVQPLATTTGCVSIHLDAFFPGFRPGDYYDDSSSGGDDNDDDGTTTTTTTTTTVSGADKRVVVLTYATGIMTIWMITFKGTLFDS